MKRIAPGFWIRKMDKVSAHCCYLRIGRRWFYTNFWSEPTKPEQRVNIEPFCRGLGYPTLAQAISASKGNRAS